jgi:hypothetical protein
MLRKLFSRGGAPLAVFVRTVLGIAALASAVALPAEAAGPKVIQLLSIETSQRITDVDPKGNSTGDKWYSTSRLQNLAPQFGLPKGAVVGTDRGTMTVLGPTSASLDSTTKLPGGTLRVRGRVRLRPQGGLIFPVVGGTGLFAGARGTLTILGQKDPKRAANIYALTYVR